MKKFLFILTLLVVNIVSAQAELTYVEGTAYKMFTTAELDAITTKVEGDTYYDTTKKSKVFWDGTQWKEGGGTNHIDAQSPIPSFDFVLGTTAALNAITFDPNTVLIPTDNNGDFVTTDGYVTGLTLGIVGSDLTLTANLNGLSDVVSNTVSLPSGGVSDHGALTGLSDDDHPQYLRSDANDTYTGDMTISDGSQIRFGTTGNSPSPTGLKIQHNTIDRVWFDMGYDVDWRDGGNSNAQRFKFERVTGDFTATGRVNATNAAPDGVTTFLPNLTGSTSSSYVVGSASGDYYRIGALGHV
ncbi:MAG: hypothetical protein AB3N18_04525, partial [Allomuricauda sp.]